MFCFEMLINNLIKYEPHTVLSLGINFTVMITFMIWPDGYFCLYLYTCIIYLVFKNLSLYICVCLYVCFIWQHKRWMWMLEWWQIHIKDERKILLIIWVKEIVPSMKDKNCHEKTFFFKILSFHFALFCIILLF